MFTVDILDFCKNNFVEIRVRYAHETRLFEIYMKQGKRYARCLLSEKEFKEAEIVEGYFTKMLLDELGKL